MQVKYYPELDDNGNRIRNFAFAALLRDNHNTSIESPWMMAVHGIGERSDGKKENLENLVLGSKQPDGTRKWPFVTDDMKRAVEDYGIIMFIPTYKNFFEPDIINRIYDFGQTEFNLVSKFALSGFSLGGGAVVKYMTSTLANAQRLALALPCAPTTAIGDATVVGKANLPVQFFVNVNDTNGATNLNVTKNQVNAMNATNPVIKVQFTAFNLTGHGGFTEAMTIAPPIAPGGQGVTNLSENIYEAYLDILKNGPRPMKAGVIVPPTTQPPTTVKPITSYTIDATGIHLRGDQSTGYSTGLDGGWRLISGPPGTNVYNVFPGGSTYINADGKLPVAGIYVFEFSLRGASPVRVTVVYPPDVETKVVIGFSSVTDTITYSNSTSEKGEATYANGKWTLKNSAGQIVTL